MSTTPERPPRQLARRPRPALGVARSARLPAFHDLTLDPLQALGALTVGVVGCGSIGGRVALHLARAGVGGLVLVDPDRHGPESLLTHAAAPGDVGTAKAVRLASRARALAPGARVRSVQAVVETLDPLDLLEVRVLVVATDNVPAELACAQLALRLGVPCLQASLHGETLTAQVRVTGLLGAEGACLGCLLGPRELAEGAAGARYPCDGGPARALAPPTMSVSALCGLAADVAVLELLRLVLRLVPGGGDALVEHNAYARRTVVSPARRDPRCPLEHRAYERATCLQAPGALTPRALAAAAGIDAGGEEGASLALGVAGLEWIERALCACGRAREVMRFRTPAAARGRCPECGGRPAVPAVHRARRLSGPALVLRLDRALTRLGAARARAVLVETRERAVVLTARDAAPAAAGPTPAPVEDDT